jgi:hypothetical protein
MDSQNTLRLESITNAGSPQHKAAGKELVEYHLKEEEDCTEKYIDVRRRPYPR